MLEKIIKLLKFENTKKFYIEILLSIISCILCEFGIGCFYTASVGADPISVFVEGTSFHCDLTVGQISTICNIIQTVLILIFIREYFGAGTFIQVLIAGPFIDIFCNILQTNFDPATTSLIVKWIMLVVGLLTYSFGLALSIVCNMGIGPFSFVPLFLEKYTPIKIKYTQIISDAVYFVVGWLLGGIVGLGTVVVVILTGPIMDASMKALEPLLKKID